MVDLSFLQNFTKGDEKKMKRYINLYLDVAPQTFEKMAQNIHDNDWGQLRINAHSLKPQADFMGVSELKEALVKIEEAIKVNDFENISKDFDYAMHISKSSINILKDILKQLP